jgi:hypothetical protein
MQLHADDVTSCRAKGIDAVAKQPGALVPAWAVRYFAPIVRLLISMFISGAKKKYPFEFNADAVRGELLKVRKALETSGGEYILGKLSFAGTGCHCMSTSIRDEVRLGAARRPIRSGCSIFANLSLCSAFDVSCA